METKYKLSIPEPCHENWDKMTPKDNGRFCLSCAKTVVDFTTMLPEEIQHYFISNQGKSICGRFKNTQLDEIIIQIPSRVLYSQTHYPKMFLLALFVAMGTTLFSCQDKNGNKQKISTVEIVDDTLNKKPGITKGLSSKPDSKNSSEQTPPPPPPPSKTASEDNDQKPIAKVTMGIIIPSNLNNGSFEYDIIYDAKDLDVLPAPENGMKNFYAFFSKNYGTADQTGEYEGRMFVLFVVEKDGTLSNFNILRNTSTASGEKVIEVLKKAPKWVPGKLKNRIVRSTYMLPITFKM